ncbi:helix-turn-helix domain-containing protein [Sphingoaurantiacus capsulatus]|uniref:helix-turn-helix domain-containing protein n=1 Tax=Sphingoaurantiacus capsulatus TaxID=1771310 RepID=UPI0036D3E6E0
MRFADRLWWLRDRLGFPYRPHFAAAFGFTVAALRDLEAGRTQPSRSTRILVAAIELDPDLIKRAAAVVRHELNR